MRHKNDSNNTAAASNTSSSSSSSPSFTSSFSPFSSLTYFISASIAAYFTCVFISFLGLSYYFFLDLFSSRSVVLSFSAEDYLRASHLPTSVLGRGCDSSSPLGFDSRSHSNVNLSRQISAFTTNLILGKGKIKKSLSRRERSGK